MLFTRSRFKLRSHDILHVQRCVSLAITNVHKQTIIRPLLSLHPIELVHPHRAITFPKQAPWRAGAIKRAQAANHAHPKV